MSYEPTVSDGSVSRKTSKRILNILKGSHSNQPGVSAAQSSATDLRNDESRPRSLVDVAEGISRYDHSVSNRDVSNCHCCGSILAYPDASTKFKCATCNTTNYIQNSTRRGSSKNASISTASHGSELSPSTPPPLSYREICNLVDECMVRVERIEKNPGDANSHPIQSSQVRTLHTIFEPLSKRLHQAFRSKECLNKSFLIKATSKTLHYSRSNLDIQGIKFAFNLLTKLPTKRPLYYALTGAVDLLKRVNLDSQDDPRNLYYILILLEIPFLSQSIVSQNSQSGSINRMIDVPEIRSLLQEILTKSIGVLSNSTTPTSSNYICSWFSKAPSELFRQKVELLNIYITFHLKKYYEKLQQSKKKRSLSTTGHQSGNSKDDGAENADLLGRRGSVSNEDKIKINQYGNDWHLKSAAIVLSMFFRANSIRPLAHRLPCNIFYNSLVDFIHVKMDFDSWQNRKEQKHTSNSQAADGVPDIQTVIEYIQDSQRSRRHLFNSATFYVCQYPFLISLGAKITILEYEARRKMERKAEEAFINSLDKKVAIDVYFRVRIRREYIVQDSLRCIQLNSANLKKSLKVQFIDEPGIDAGGLKKEWFLLLSKQLFNPQAGLFIENEESKFLWFNIVPIDKNEMYYLFGAILGLAIYNSTILDLQFPQALYKSLLNVPVTFEDYTELYPDIAKNLVKLKDFTNEELVSLELTFEVTFVDAFGKSYTKELVPNGKRMVVSKSNVNFYVEKYSQYFIRDGISKQLESFISGFKAVIGGNALSLFHSEEIELLICGSDEKRLDVDILRSITKYVGLTDREDAESDKVVKWFWDYMSSINFKTQKKLLQFVTGSDRVPATGLQNLNFKIRRVGGSKNSERLPIAHTCFNELELYNYKSKESLVKKLSMAINDSSGFGIK